MKETWKEIPVPNCKKRYFLSSTGRVSSLYKGVAHELSIPGNNKGYKQLHIVNRDHKQIHYSLPKLMQQLYDDELARKVFNINVGISREKILDIKKMCATTDISLNKIARHFNVHPNIVARIRRGESFKDVAPELTQTKKLPRGYAPMPVSKIKKLISLLAQGKTLTYISKHVPCSVSTAYRYKMKVKNAKR